MESLEKLKSDFDLIIWDFDGTIVDLDIHWNSLKIDLINLCIEHQLKFNNKKINELLEILTIYSLEAQSFKIINNYESRATYIYNQKIIDIIKFFKGKKQCILSDNLKKTIVKILEKLSISDHFCFVVSKNDVNHYKPKTEGLEKILLQYNKIDISRILYIGDSWKDDHIAKTFNIKFLKVEEITI